MDGYDNFFENGIAIGRPFYWVMLIVWQGENKAVAERRGLGGVFLDSLEHILHPGKVWKEIVLA